MTTTERVRVDPLPFLRQFPGKTGNFSGQAIDILPGMLYPNER